MSVRLRVLAAAVAAALLAGCGGLTGTGEVEPGLEVGSGKAPDLGFLPAGPRPGAGQDGIVRGFLQAGAASGGVYDNARKFLTAQASERWDPDETIVLLADDEPPATTLVDPATVRVTAKAAGTVDSRGRLRAAAPGATVTATVSLTSVGGEWRIAELPDGFGRWIAQSDVPRLVQPFAVHYISTSRRATLPDLRWFPLDRLATRLARAQLDAVPEHLVGAGTTAVPNGARLLGDAVSVDTDGVASVNLVASRMAPGEVARQNLWAQFLTTLTQDPSVSAVSLAVDGVAVDLDGVDGPVDSLSRVGFPAAAPSTTTTKPVVRRGTRVDVFDPTAGTRQQDRPATPPGGYPAVPADDTHLALSADGAELAAVTPSGDGLSRWRGSTRYEVPGLGVDVGAPAYDRRGFLWVGAVGQQAQRLFVVDTRADPATAGATASVVRADWLAGRRVLEARVAADGDRIAVLSVRADGSAPVVDLAGVVRGSGQRPERLAAPLHLGVPFTAARGLAWLDEQQIATIAATRGSGARPLVLSVDGSVSTLTAAPGARTVAATGESAASTCSPTRAGCCRARGCAGSTAARPTTWPRQPADASSPSRPPGRPQAGPTRSSSTGRGAVLADPSPPGQARGRGWDRAAMERQPAGRGRPGPAHPVRGVRGSGRAVVHRVPGAGPSAAPGGPPGALRAALLDRHRARGAGAPGGLGAQGRRPARPAPRARRPPRRRTDPRPHRGPRAAAGPALRPPRARRPGARDPLGGPAPRRRPGRPPGRRGGRPARRPRRRPVGGPAARPPGGRPVPARAGRTGGEPRRRAAGA
ncbi:hypothetical protein G7075_10215 [Phycicoccus sp. HDW14]|uniref:GerMN domain-containing protein n=1 Tax=Phycicoccus sp. HDW14 TaxID=2714941 RepID=UPI00140B2191|nr:GerMN domain-containing protein [Phycicoccus sp. HDW14]QIM21408.1 hypothetical protein G7075_10215 [Phycicoccus sp. HDW14]